MSGRSTFFTKRGIKRKASHGPYAECNFGTLRSIDIHTSSQPTKIGYCDDCSSSEFLDFLSIGSPQKVVRDIGMLWRNETCPCCHYLRQVVFRENVPEHIGRNWSEHGVCLVFVRRSRKTADYLQRLDLSGSHDIIQMYVKKGGRYWPSWQHQPDRTSARLETTSAPCLRLADSKTKYAMVRRPIKSSMDYAEVKGWINECDADHSRHSLPAHSPPDDLTSLAQQGRFRVIDVISKKIVCNRRIDRYCALSYVWGKLANDFSLSKAHPTTHEAHSLAHNMNEEWNRLPKTVSDAIEFTRNIGEQYLWIDYLCINQSNTQDKDANIRAMSSIYNRAYITIIAADSVDAKSGLRRLVPACEAEVPIMIPRQTQDESIGLLCTRPTVEEILKRGVWSSRGWTYQEHMLSTRCVIFADDELLFDCSHRIYREAYELIPNPSYRAIDLPGKKVRKTHSGKRQSLHGKAVTRRLRSARDFHDFLATYTSRELTYPGDRLDAFSAILRKFNDVGSTPLQRYAESGIPISLMYFVLPWSVSWKPGSRKECKTISTDASGTRDFPTWSWIAWSAKVDNPFILLQRHNSKPALKFVVMDKYNIVAYATAQRGMWSRWTQDQIPLCRPEPRGPVTIHLMGEVIPVSLGAQEVGPVPLDGMIEVGLQDSRNGIFVSSIHTEAKYIWDENCNTGFALLIWSFEGPAFVVNTRFILIREIAENFYNRVAPEAGTISWYDEPCHDVQPVTKYIRLR